MSETELDERPWYERYSEEEVRAEAKRYSEAYYAMINALRDLPEVPDWRVLRLLSRAARFPEDWEIGKGMQREHGLDTIPPKTEYEQGAGLWKRIRDGLTPNP